MTNSETIARRFHDDWVLVPRKITEAMCDACHDVPIGFAGSPPHPQHIWDAMLAAAPPAPVVTDEMVERALDEMFRFDGNLRNAVFIATGQSAACDAAERAWNNVYDVETHSDGSRADNRYESMRAALTAALTPRDDAGEASPPADDDRTLWGVAANAGRLSAERKFRWAHVVDATGQGSNSAASLCRRFGFDPDEMVGGGDAGEG